MTDASASSRPGRRLPAACLAAFVLVGAGAVLRFVPRMAADAVLEARGPDVEAALAPIRERRDREAAAERASAETTLAKLEALDREIRLMLEETRSSLEEIRRIAKEPVGAGR